jgi:hypothetical protein
MLTQGAAHHVNQVLRVLLRPVARLALRFGLQLGDVIEALKVVMVATAQEFSTDALSASRLSAMTGVHRKDIQRLRRSEFPDRPTMNLVSRVMAHWQLAKPYCARKGIPRPLGCEGRESEFAQLVASVNGGDVSGYAVLYEMERRGIIRRARGRVQLLWKDYAPDDDERGQLQQLAVDVDDLSRAIEQNLFSTPEVRNHHLRTEFDAIPLDKLPQIQSWLLEEGSRFHERVRKFLARYDGVISVTQESELPRARVVYGSFGLCKVREPKAASPVGE